MNSRYVKISIINYIFIQFQESISNNKHLLHPKTISRNKIIIHETIIQEHSILTRAFIQKKKKEKSNWKIQNQSTITKNKNIDSITINIFKFFHCSKFSKKYISTRKLFKFTLFFKKTDESFLSTSLFKSVETITREAERMAADFSTSGSGWKGFDGRRIDWSPLRESTSVSILAKIILARVHWAYQFDRDHPSCHSDERQLSYPLFFGKLVSFIEEWKRSSWTLIFLKVSFRKLSWYAL